MQGPGTYFYFTNISIFIFNIPTSIWNSDSCGPVYLRWSGGVRILKQSPQTKSNVTKPFSLELVDLQTVLLIALATAWPGLSVRSIKCWPPENSIITTKLDKNLCNSFQNVTFKLCLGEMSIIMAWSKYIPRWSLTTSSSVSMPWLTMGRSQEARCSV